MILLCILLLLTLAMDSAVTEKIKEYQCNSFLNEEVDDHVMTYYYSVIARFVKLISKPFPQDLLSDRALLGDLKEIKRSVLAHYIKWIKNQEWPLFIVGITIATVVVFFFVYIFYSIYKLCCDHEKDQLTDFRFDSYKRNFFNILMTVLIITNTFAVAALSVSTQYAEYGVHQLPLRLARCVNDLSIYQQETKLKINNLLIGDFLTFNSTFVDTISMGGREIVYNVKRITGAQAIDKLVQVNKEAVEIVGSVQQIERNLSLITDRLTILRANFSRLRRTSVKDLQQCVKGEGEPDKNICLRAIQIIKDTNQFASNLHSDILSEEAVSELKLIRDLNLSQALSAPLKFFGGKEEDLQQKIDEKKQSVLLKLNEIRLSLSSLSESLSLLIEQVNFKPIYSFMWSQVDEKSEYQIYLRHSWYSSLILSCIFIIITLYFLISLLYGCCGRRPTYYNDDCCVKTTGSKLLACGIWLVVFLLPSLTVLFGGFFFVSVNLTNLLCSSFEEPLSRPDVLSLAERYFNLWKSFNPGFNLTLPVGRNISARIIQSCISNQTLYQFFDLDRKYHLYELRRYDHEAYDKLEDYIQSILSEANLPPTDTFIDGELLNVLSSFGKQGLSLNSNITWLDSVEKAIDELNVLSRIQPLIEELSNSSHGQSKVFSIFERIKVIEAENIGPIREVLLTLSKDVLDIHKNISSLFLLIPNLAVKLRHAQALLSSDFSLYVRNAAATLKNKLNSQIYDFTSHVRSSMLHEVTSCVPLKNIVLGSKSALCTHTIDPINGVWASMIICFICFLPIVIIGTPLLQLYRRMHPFSKYIVHEPQKDWTQTCAFVTDTFNSKLKNDHYVSSYEMYYADR